VDNCAHVGNHSCNFRHYILFPSFFLVYKELQLQSGTHTDDRHILMT